MTKIKFISKIDKLFYKVDRDLAWVDQNYRCKYCHETISRSDVTYDHVVPLSQNNRLHNKHNAVVACKKCNNDKKNMSLTEFIETRNNDSFLQNMLDRIEDRIKLAEYKLDTIPKGGSFNKWKKYHKKRGRW